MCVCIRPRSWSHNVELRNYEISKIVQHTAVFVERMDRIFNAFNSQTLTSTTPMLHVLSDTSQHEPFLVECNEWLSKVASLGSRKLPCISGWRMATNCVLQLWSELRDEHHFKFLLTNRHCLENLRRGPEIYHDINDVNKNHYCCF